MEAGPSTCTCRSARRGDLADPVCGRRCVGDYYYDGDDHDNDGVDYYDDDGCNGSPSDVNGRAADENRDTTAAAAAKVAIILADEISALLESRKGKPLMIKLRSGKVVNGILRDFDIHMTMKLDSISEVSADGKERDELDTVLLRGDNIVMISIPDDDDAA